MRFTIQYLRESTEEDSVCHTVMSKAQTLEDAGDEAFAAAFSANTIFGACGFQIRDARRGGEVVALEAIDRFARPRWLS